MTDEDRIEFRAWLAAGRFLRDLEGIRQDAKDKALSENARKSSREIYNVLIECEEYFDQRADISNETDDDGTAWPNEEMRLLADVREVLDKIETTRHILAKAQGENHD